jgi:Flp pilus assembly protein protease CpaA
MVSDLASNFFFPSLPYFTYFDIKSTAISSKMVSDLTSNFFPSLPYFTYFDIKSTKISSKMVIFLFYVFIFLQLT